MQGSVPLIALDVRVCATETELLCRLLWTLDDQVLDEILESTQCDVIKGRCALGPAREHVKERTDGKSDVEVVQLEPGRNNGN